MKKSIFILPIVLLALAACAPGAEPVSEDTLAIAGPTVTESSLAEVETKPPPTAVPTAASPANPTAVPTAAPTEAPTLAPTADPTPETAVVAGRTEAGAFFLGSPAAPVTMIDYSDFL